MLILIIFFSYLMECSFIWVLFTCVVPLLSFSNLVILPISKKDIRTLFFKTKVLATYKFCFHSSFLFKKKKKWRRRRREENAGTEILHFFLMLDESEVLDKYSNEFWALMDISDCVLEYLIHQILSRSVLLNMV